MKHSANRPAFYLSITQLVLALSCLLALSTNVIGFQADAKDSPQTEEKEAEQKEDDTKAKDKTEVEDEGKDEAEKDAKPDFLKIGSKAPALKLDYWPTDKNGLLPPVKKFQSGKTYVLNFFQPENEYSVDILKSMVELQEKYADKPVQIVCICSADRDATDEFLDSEVKGDKDETYIDLLNPVSTASDSELVATRAYIARAGILTASTFIVGPTGKVEWLGRPTEVKKPLAQVVKGKWDRKAFAKEIEPQQIRVLGQLETQKKFIEWASKIPAEKRTSPQGLLEELAKGAKDPANKAFLVRIESSRMSLMLRALEADADIDNLEEDLSEVMRNVTKLSDDDPNLELNNNSWKVYEMYEADTIDKDSKLMKAAKEMAEKALTFRPKSGAVNDTVAHFVYLLEGDLDRAIKLQKIAIENSEDTDTEALEDFLKFLEKEQETGKKKSLQKQDGDKGGDGDSDF